MFSVSFVTFVFFHFSFSPPLFPLSISIFFIPLPVLSFSPHFLLPSISSFSFPSIFHAPSLLSPFLLLHYSISSLPPLLSALLSFFFYFLFPFAPCPYNSRPLHRSKSCYDVTSSSQSVLLPNAIRGS